MLNKKEGLALLSTPSHLWTPDSKYIFLLSHMRSRSSLLSHIIGTSPSISGSGELQISYSNVKKGLIKNNIELDSKRFHFDKILHNGLTQNPSFFYRNFKFVMMIRPLEETIHSLFGMRNRKGTPDKFYRGDLKYLADRLGFLKEKSEALKNRYFFINSDELISHSSSTLLSLSNFLGLPETLDENYIVTEQTGDAKYGDTSQNILKGTILNNKSKRYELDIENKVLQNLDSIWAECYESLLKNSANFHPNF